MNLAPKITRPPEAIRILEDLASLAQVTVSDDLIRFCRAFEANLRHFGELGVHSADRQVAALTLGCGEAFGHEVAEYLRAAGYPADSCALPIRLQSMVDDWMLVRLGSDGSDRSELAVYFRRTLPVSRVLTLLGGLGVPATERDAVGELARVLDASRVGILGAKLSRTGRTAFQVYIHAHDEPAGPLQGKLAKAFERFEIPAPRWARFVQCMHGGRPPVPDVLTSLIISEDQPHTSLSLSYFQIDLAELERCLVAAGALAADDLHPTRVAARIGLDSAEHAAVIFAPTRVSWTCYASPALHRALHW
jgi:hypothetical protein